MRKTAALCLLLTFALTGVTPLTAQRSIDSSASKLARNTEFATLRAITDGSGVLVRWQLQSDSSVIGFNVYRVTDSSKDRVNESIVANIFARSANAKTAGELNQYFDVDGRAGARYVIEGLRFDGTKFLSEATQSVNVASVEAESGTSGEAFAAAAASPNSSVESRISSLSRDLADVVSTYTQQPDPENQKVIASKAAAKLSVKQDGFYRVTSADLQAASFPVASDASKWRLFTNGVEQAIIVGPNQSYIEFYGRGIDVAETDTRMYYLVADTVAGKRIGSKTLRAVPGSPLARNYPVVAVKKERTTFNPVIFNGDDDNFLGDLFVTRRTSRFNVTGLDLSVPDVTVKLTFFGVNVPQFPGPHQIRAKINGVELPLITEPDDVLYSGQFRLPTATFREGQNDLEMVGSSDLDYNQFDKIEVSYQRKFAAEADKLSFSTSGSRKLELTGFSTSAIRVFDLTFEGNPVLLNGIATTEGSEGFNVQVPSTRAMVGYAFEDSALLRPAAIKANTPSTLSAASNGADMVIISSSSADFLAGSESWADYRRSAAGGNLSVKVIDVADTYDEFNYGLSGYEGIRRFLEYASTQWSTRPRYVLLMGDATYDPRGYHDPNTFNLVPTRFVPLVFEESPSDEALGDFDDDGLSSLAVGRISARSAAQITTALGKTKAFEANQTSLNNGALFAHENDPEFEAMSQVLSQKLPQTTPVTMVNSAEANASATLLDVIGRGNLIVNYSGHGATGLWASTEFFTNAMVPQLTNRNRPSFFSMLTCRNGYFIRPSGDALAETLLFSDAGGAAAAWGSSGQSTSDFQLFMAQKFFDELVTSHERRVGDLIKEAKLAIPAGPDVRLSWVLIGDPALKMP